MLDAVIRAYHPQDALAVAELMSAVYGPAATPSAIWRWRHFGWNAERSATLVATSQGRLVGLRPMEIYDFHLGGTPLRGGVFSGVMVHPEHRRRGLFTRLVEASEQLAWERGASFVTTMPNQRSFPGFIKKGYADPGCRQLMLRPCRPVRALCHHLGPFGQALRSLANLEDDAAKSFEAARVDKAIHSGPCSFDSAYDELALAHAARFPGLVLTRDAHWLQWRFAASPWHHYQLHSLRKAGHLAGYAITTQAQHKKTQVGYLIDLVALEGTHRRALAQAALVSLAHQGCHLLATVVSSPHLQRDLLCSGLLPVPTPLSPKRFYTVYRANAKATRELAPLSRISSWYLTLGDWDTL